MIIVLDLDGTLLDIRAKYYAVYSQILKNHGCETLDIEDYWDMKRKGVSNGEILLKGNCSLSEDDFVKEFIENIERSDFLKLDALMPGAVEFLKKISNDTRLVLVTLRKNKETLLEQLDSMGIRKYFTVVANDTTKDIKTAWQRKKHLFKVYGKGKCVVVIGDSGAEIKAGKTLDFITLALFSGIRSKSVLEKYEPDYILRDINNVLPCLTEKGII